MVDYSDNGCLLCSSIPVNNVNDISTSSEHQPTPVTCYTISYSALHCFGIIESIVSISFNQLLLAQKSDL
jgi:hypothetical protein